MVVDSGHDITDSAHFPSLPTNHGKILYLSILYHIHVLPVEAVHVSVSLLSVSNIHELYSVSQYMDRKLVFYPSCYLLILLNYNH